MAAWLSPLLLVWIGLVAGLVLSSHAQTNLQVVPLEIGLSRSSFLGVNQSDAEASFKAFMINIAERRGYVLEPHTRVYEDAAIYEQVIRTNPPHVAVVDAWEFLTMNLGSGVEPRYVVPQVSGLFNTYVLLTRVGSGLDHVGRLAGKEIICYESMNAKLSRTWLAVLMHEQVKPEAHQGTEFFSSIESANKPSLAVLPVFFGKKQACVITESGFQVLKEMNPQLGRELQIIGTSEGYMETIVCLSRQGWITPQYKEDFMRSLEELHLAPSGQQVLNLFKADRAVPFEPRYLNSIRALRENFDRLQAVRKTSPTQEASKP